MVNDDIEAAGAMGDVQEAEAYRARKAADVSPQEARKQALQAEGRPEQLFTDSATITKSVRSTETRDTIKVYVKDWRHAFTGTPEECEAYRAKTYEGRLHEGDWKIGRPFKGSNNEWLSIRVWNVWGEFKEQFLAEEFAANYTGKYEVQVVGRNSRQEVELKDYSVKKLVGRARDLRAKPEAQ